MYGVSSHHPSDSRVHRSWKSKVRTVMFKQLDQVSHVHALHLANLAKEIAQLFVGIITHDTRHALFVVFLSRGNKSGAEAIRSCLSGRFWGKNQCSHSDTFSLQADGRNLSVSGYLARPADLRSDFAIEYQSQQAHKSGAS